MEGALLRSIHGNVVEVDAQTRHLTTDRLNALESTGLVSRDENVKKRE
jgi:hypothetical protein